MEKTLKREITLWGLTANLVNTIIGAGIFALPALVAEGLGSASITAYLFCGFLILLVMLCFAEVGSKVTSSGGVYGFIEESFGPYFGFLTVVVFVISCISADAAVANAVFNITASIFPILQNEVIRILFLLIIFFGLAFINVIGSKQGIGLVKFITLAKVIPLFILILIGFKEVTLENLIFEQAPSLSALGETSLILFFAFQGVEAAISINGEVKDPQKNIPRAVLISVTLILAFYILIQTISQGILGDELPLYKDNTLGEVANRIIGPLGLTLLSIGAAVSMFGNLSSEILSIPRSLFSAAKDGIIPIKYLSRIHPKFATPYTSIMTYAGLGFIFAISSHFEQLAIISVSGALMIYLGVSLAVIKLRRNGINYKNSFTIPGGLIVPILSSLTIIWFLSNLAYLELVVLGLFIVVLSLFYFLMVHLRKKHNSKNNKLT
ncbi:APC family permease [Namhaeicola litoreus]|uniref:APC family permease n=1 Tax=Namhaeicola litoreus TaxID=1052145 RepID=A0ABW3XZ52_9FLAO